MLNNWYAAWLQYQESAHPVAELGRHASQSFLKSDTNCSGQDNRYSGRASTNQPLAMDVKSEEQDIWNDSRPQQGLRQQDQGYASPITSSAPVQNV